MVDFARGNLKIEKRLMFNLANLFTGFNLISGILSIVLLLNGRIDLAPLFILLAFVFDFFDGFIARKMKTAGPIGVQLDSLADMVTFGVAPGLMVMVLMVMNVEPFLSNHHYELIQFDFNYWVESLIAGNTDYYLPLVALLIPFMSMFRLAKFNLDERQHESFIGLPTPAHTAFYMMFPLVLSFDHETIRENWSWMWVIFDQHFIMGFVLLLSFMLVSEIPLFSLKFKTFSLKSNEIRYMFLLISLGIIIFLGFWSISIIVFLYLILSFIENRFIKKASE